MVGTNDLEKSTSFYDKILAVLGLKKVTTTERYVGYSNGYVRDLDGNKITAKCIVSK